MRAPCALLFASVTALAGCSASDLASSEVDSSDCAGRGASVSLDVEPAALQRDDPVDILVRWELSARASEPTTATLIAGAASEIEVELVLALDPEATGVVYRASQLNPFGAGVPPGTVVVLASGKARDGCAVPATATTTFELQ
jgi:hypothetical protein